jgi:hypothetical protein
VTENISLEISNLVTPRAGAKLVLFVKKPVSEAGLLKKTLA